MRRVAIVGYYVVLLATVLYAMIKGGFFERTDAFGGRIINQTIDDTDKFACPGKGPANAQELAWWRAHATPEHPCPKEQPKQ